VHRGNDFWQTKAGNHLMSKIVLGNTVQKSTLSSYVGLRGFFSYACAWLLCVFFFFYHLA